MTVAVRHGVRLASRLGPAGGWPVLLGKVRIMLRYFAVVIVAAIGLAVALVALVLPAAHSFASAGKTDGNEDVVAMTDLDQSSTVYAHDGSVLEVLHAVENRSSVTFDQIPKGVINAVVDTEDDKFWQHNGINPSAMGRALLSDVNSGGLGQGGSTITQQLIKNTVHDSEKKMGRKVREAVLAVRLEGKLTKQQIIQRYLNTIYFGNGAYGINAAAGTYFGETVEQLNLGQGAFLAGMIRNPVGYDPFRFPRLSRARRDFVIDRMLKQGDLTPEQAVFLKATAIPTVKVPDKQPDSSDAYFTTEVKDRLLADPRLGDTLQARYHALFGGGLKIYTTLDPWTQAAAKKAMADNLPTEGGKWAGALVSVDPSTGAVRALIGGPGFDHFQFDIATQGHGLPPGSSFKPIVLATALQQGYQPYAGVDGTFPCPLPDGKGGIYRPQNDEGETQGYTNITDAMAYSVNCAYARMGLAVKLKNVVKMAKSLGITYWKNKDGSLDPYTSMSLGSEEVHPIDMAGAYATFANDGVHHTPFLVDHIVDRTGKVIFTGGDQGNIVLTPQKAREEVQVLRSVVTQNGATGVAANLYDREVAGKTGTTDENKNAWFVGFAPQLATAVWMGSPVAQEPMTFVGGATASGRLMYGRTVYGGTYPAMIFHDFMSAALAFQPAIPFHQPNPYDLGTLTYVPSNDSPFNGAPPPIFPPPTFPPPTIPGFGPLAPGAPIPGMTTTTVAGGQTTTTLGGPPTTLPKWPLPTFPMPTVTTLKQ